MKKLAFTTAEGIYLFFPDQIVRLVASSNYTEIHTTERKPIIAAKVLHNYDSLIHDFGFLRINRSFIINPHHLVMIMSASVLMSDGTQINIPRHSKSEFSEQLLNHIKHI